MHVAPLPISAWLSIWLRSLLLLVAGLFSTESFFLPGPVQMAGLDRLAHRVQQDDQLLPDFRCALAFVQQHLRLGLHLVCQYDGGPPPTRGKEPCRAFSR